MKMDECYSIKWAIRKRGKCFVKGANAIRKRANAIRKRANAIRKRANAIRPYVRFYRYMKHFSPFFEQLFYVVVFRYALSLPCKRKKIYFRSQETFIL